MLVSVILFLLFKKSNSQVFQLGWAKIAAPKTKATKRAPTWIKLQIWESMQIDHQFALTKSLQAVMPTKTRETFKRLNWKSLWSDTKSISFSITARVASLRATFVRQLLRIAIVQMPRRRGSNRTEIGSSRQSRLTERRNSRLWRKSNSFKGWTQIEWSQFLKGSILKAAFSSQIVSSDKAIVIYTCSPIFAECLQRLSLVRSHHRLWRNLATFTSVKWSTSIWLRRIWSLCRAFSRTSLLYFASQTSPWCN